MQSNPGPRLALVAGTVTVTVETRDILDSNFVVEVSIELSFRCLLKVALSFAAAPSDSEAGGRNECWH